MHDMMCISVYMTLKSRKMSQNSTSQSLISLNSKTNFHSRVETTCDTLETKRGGGGGGGGVRETMATCTFT